MNLSLSKRLNEILKQYVSAPPEFSEKVVQWVDDLQRETSAADHENLREDIRDLKDDIRAQRSASDSQFTLLWNSQKDLKEDFKDLKEDVTQVKADVTDLKLSTAERFNALEKTNIRLNVQMWCIIFLLGVLVFPTIQKFLQH